MVGEKGPEAIVPLDKGMGRPINIHIHDPVFADDEMALRKWGLKLKRIIDSENRLTFGKAYSG